MGVGEKREIPPTSPGAKPGIQIDLRVAGCYYLVAMSTTLELPNTKTGSSQIRDYARLVKIEHALFSLPMFAAGALLAGPSHFPVWSDWLLIAVAGTAARNLALAFNRLIDRNIDKLNPRTQDRELPSGRLNVTQVASFIAANFVVYLTAAWNIAPICLYLSPIPVAVFVLYPFLKRFTVLCHIGVGAGLALAPLGGYLAAAKSWPISADTWLLGVFTWLWVSGFDILYAQADVDFDRAHQVYSMPARWGRRALLMSAVMHLAAVGVLFGLWFFWFGAGLWPVLPAILIAVLFYLQHRWSNRIDLAAFRVNILVGFVMFGFVILGVST
jgi:4-hydroxybenzoate polyprenyltransferase